MDADRRAFPVVQTPFMEKDGQFSPDGQWIAYTSDESGVPEVYVQRFPSRGTRLQVSINGGAWHGGVATAGDCSISASMAG